MMKKMMKMKMVMIKMTPGSKVLSEEQVIPMQFSVPGKPNKYLSFPQIAFFLSSFQVFMCVSTSMSTIAYLFSVYQ